MAKKSVIAREKKRRETVAKYAEKRARLTEIREALFSDRRALVGEENKIAQKYANPAQKAELEQLARLKAEGKWEELQKLPRDASPVRMHNRCALTGRPRGYLRKFGVCRNVFRELSVEGKIPGVRKSSW